MPRSFDLGIATEVLDSAEPPHPGLRWHLSAGGMQKYMCARGVGAWDQACCRRCVAVWAGPRC